MSGLKVNAKLKKNAKAAPKKIGRKLQKRANISKRAAAVDANIGTSEPLGDFLKATGWYRE